MNWRRCKALEKAIPRLKSLFDDKTIKLKDNERVFPLFSPKIQEAIWRTSDLNSKREAAVLVPLVSYKGQPSLLYTTRSKTIPTHPNEISFPGGHRESSDASLEDTAIREAQEELLGDYPWDEIEIIGKTTPLPSLNGTPVTPVIGVLPFEITNDTFPGNPSEVEDVFTVSLLSLTKIETSEPSNRFKSNIPVFTTTEGKRIWGLTAVITRPLLHKLFKKAI